MRATRRVSGWIIACAVALSLGGCSHSHSTASAGGQDPDAAASGPVAAYSPTIGTFAEVGQADAGARTTDSCSVDAIGGAAPGEKPIPHAGMVLFAGWAAAGDKSAAPAALELVLTGAVDFGVRTPTGAPRADVAAATHQPGLAKSGYEVNTWTSNIPSGVYKIELRYEAAGASWRCNTGRTIVVQ